jgi:hypothetical protein
MKIMVTGSRDWDRPDIVTNKLMLYKSNYPTIIVGDCPTGVDNIVRQFCYLHGWPVEVFEADWLRQGRAAGPIRNRAMVDTKPDLCLGFPKGSSPGTRNAISLAKKAGILTITIDYDAF